MNGTYHALRQDKKNPKGVLQRKEQSYSHKLIEHLGVFS